MPPSASRVASIHLAASEPGGYWANALPDLQVISGLLTALERKPLDEALLRKTLKAIDKAVGIATWSRNLLPPDIYAPLLTVRREVSVHVKSKTLDVGAAALTVDRYKGTLQEILDNLAPEHLTYSGFKFDNPEHLPWSVCRLVFAGFDFLQTIFKKRGVLAALVAGVKRVVLDATPDASAFFDSRSRVLTVSTRDLLKTGRFSDTFIGETLIHEIGHFIHRNYITGEAAAVWDAPWKGLPSLANPNNYEHRKSPERARRLDPLEIVTEYGKTDQYEDFAETFMVFMISPEKLSAPAMYRMQQALSLSGLYGKPVMRVGHDEVQVEVVGV